MVNNLFTIGKWIPSLLRMNLCFSSLMDIEEGSLTFQVYPRTWSPLPNLGIRVGLPFFHDSQEFLSLDHIHLEADLGERMHVFTLSIILAEVLIVD